MVRVFCVAAVFGLFGATRVSGSVDNGGLDDPNASRMSTQYWRACHRGSGSLVEDINIPYDIADPPELPFPGAELQFALVAQRHGTRRSQYLWSKSPYYKGTAPSQLSVQGAYELRVSGIEVRHYLQKYKKHKLPSGKVFNVEDGLNPGGNVQYPRNGYHVRVLYGKPGKQMEALVLPWCQNKTVCPLNDFLNFTYGLLKSKSFLDVTDVYRTKLREAAKRLV